MSRLLLTLILLAAAASFGCGGPIITNSAVYGPYPDAPERELFARVTNRVETRGYEVLDADPSAGHFAVRSHALTPDGRAIFRFRFYRGGWVAVTVVGGGARRNGDGHFVVPRTLHREYAARVEGLMNSEDE